MLSPLYIHPHDVFGIVFLAPMPSLPVGSYRISSLMFLSDNGRLEFTPFFLSVSLFFSAVIYYSSLYLIDSHFDYRFNFDLHTCGSLPLGLANFLLVLFLSHF